MKLYFAPGACSLSPHIVLREAGARFELEQVNNAEKKTKSGEDYWKVNPKGQVPVLMLDSGEKLTEGPVIVQYIADQTPSSGLAPAMGSMDRYRVQEWLNFTTSELHKQFSPLFAANTPADYKSIVRERIAKRFDWLAGELAGRDYLMGTTFTVADAYLFVILNWTRFAGVDLDRWPVLAAYHARVAARPKVREAMVAEGLVKSSDKRAA